MGKIKAVKGFGKAFLDAATSKQMKKIPGGKFISFPAEILKKKKAGLAVGAVGAASADAFMEKDKIKKAYEKSKKNKNKKNDR